MTTTINMPDKLYRQADKTAEFLGMNSTQLFVVAIERYITENAVQNIVAKREKEYISDLSAAQISSMDKIWNTKEEDEAWAFL